MIYSDSYQSASLSILVFWNSYLHLEIYYDFSFLFLNNEKMTLLKKYITIIEKIIDKKILSQYILKKLAFLFFIINERNVPSKPQKKTISVDNNPQAFIQLKFISFFSQIFRFVSESCFIWNL